MFMKGRLASNSAQLSQVGDFDRRRHSRHSGAGLVVEVAGLSLPVLDVSTGGLGVSGLDRKVGERFRLVLSPSGGCAGIATECEVVSVDAKLTRLTFVRPTMPLLRLIVAHVSALTGVQPHLLKSS